MTGTDKNKYKECNALNHAYTCHVYQGLYTVHPPPRVHPPAYTSSTASQTAENALAVDLSPKIPDVFSPNLHLEAPIWVVSPQFPPNYPTNYYFGPPKYFPPDRVRKERPFRTTECRVESRFSAVRPRRPWRGWRK